MDNLYDRLIQQLDALIPFLTLAREEIFDSVTAKYNEWQPEEYQDSLPTTYTIYETQVVHSAFLLGYSYYEAFLSDLARQILLSRPVLIAKDKTIKYGDILDRPDYSAILSYIIDKEILDILYLSIEKQMECFEKRLNLSWPPDTKEMTVEAALLRNCIIHNNAYVDSRLARIGQWREGESIALPIYRVHAFGIMVRRVSASLYHQAQQNHLMVTQN